MACFDDDSRLIVLQAMVSLVIIAFVTTRRSATNRHVRVIDWTAKILFALKLTFILRAIVDTLSVDAWPKNVGSQIWLIIFITIFFVAEIRILVTSSLESSIALVSLLFGLSFMVPVLESFQTIIRHVWYFLFDVEPSDIQVTIVGLVFVAAIIACIVAMQWKGWFHTLVIGILISLDVVLGVHILVYNARWKLDSGWLGATICCSVPDLNDITVNVDGDLCPLRFNWLDCGVAILMVVVYIPMQFFIREQCLSVWCCCRARARALQMYRAQKLKPNYGIELKKKDDDTDGGVGGDSDDDDGESKSSCWSMSFVYSLLPSSLSHSGADGDDDDGVESPTNSPSPPPSQYDAHAVSARWMSAIPSSNRT